MKEFIVPTEIPEEIEFYEEHKCQEIVRCKDCKRNQKPIIPYLVGTEVWCERLDRYFKNDWFCADGERRDEQ
jgi:hypothetical protein